jgi:hypothetical protein
MLVDIKINILNQTARRLRSVLKTLCNTWDLAFTLLSYEQLQKRKQAGIGALSPPSAKPPAASSKNAEMPSKNSSPLSNLQDIKKAVQADKKPAAMDDSKKITVPVPALTAASPQRKEIAETKEKKQQLQQPVIAEKAQLQKSRPKGRGLEEQ